MAEKVKSKIREKKEKLLRKIGGALSLRLGHTARVTLLERRHLVQTYTCLGVPFTIALTRFTLGFQGRLERRWEWET